jgi:BMFP domain-containing protein YqiC
LIEAPLHPIVEPLKANAKAFSMTQTTGRFFDELGKLITDAAGAAQGVRKEIENVVRAQAENILRELDVVQREEFEAVKAMAQKAREENDALKRRIALLEAVVDDFEAGFAAPHATRPVRRRRPKRG